MVTCLPKSRAKLVGDESQAPFSAMFLSPMTGDSEAILMFIYTRGDVLYLFQPEQGSLCTLRCFLSYLFDLLKSQVPSVELAAKERSSIVAVVSPFL